MQYARVKKDLRTALLLVFRLLLNHLSVEVGKIELLLRRFLEDTAFWVCYSDESWVDL